MNAFTLTNISVSTYVRLYLCLCRTIMCAKCVKPHRQPHGLPLRTASVLTAARIPMSSLALLACACPHAHIGEVLWSFPITVVLC